MSITLIASASAGSPDQNTVTVGPINTTGANLIVLSVAKNQSGIVGAYTLTDTKSNTPIQLTPQSSSAQATVLYYYALPTVGSGHSWTLTTTGSAIFPTASVAAFSLLASSPFESETGAFSSSALSSFQPGSLTPAEDGALVISGVSFFTGTGLTVNSGFSSAFTDYAGNNLAGGIGWLIQGSKAAANPTWSITANFGQVCSTIAVFEPAPTVSGGFLLWPIEDDE